MTLPDPVQDICDHFLSVASRGLPNGLLTGLYLHGGVAFGEWEERESDVDFLATLAHRPTPGVINALRLVHEEMRAHTSTRFDGLYVLASDLARDPRTLPPVPEAMFTGAFEMIAGAGTGRLVTWHELARSGITVLGPDVSTLGVWTDEQALREYTIGNLDTYWRRNAEGLARATPADLPGDEHERDYLISHCILASVRLHHLLATGEMTAKSRAGRWALTALDERWRPILREGLRLRQGTEKSEYADLGDVLRDSSEFLAYLIRNATGQPVSRPSPTSVPGSQGRG
jgi:hypothetical protein